MIIVLKPEATKNSSGATGISTFQKAVTPIFGAKISAINRPRPIRKNKPCKYRQSNFFWPSSGTVAWYFVLTLLMGGTLFHFQCVKIAPTPVFGLVIFVSVQMRNTAANKFSN